MRKPHVFLVGSALLALAVGIPSTSAGETAGADAAASPVFPYRTGDKSVTALNILPPGQGGYMNGPDFLESQGSGEVPDHFTDQLELYAKLITNVGNVTAGTLGDYFKDASFGVKPDDIARQYSPRAGVEVIRDTGYNVPHVYGETRGDTMFGAGYVSAEDRLFMMDVLRNTGRGRLSELLGPSPANIAMDCAQYRVADYTEAELQAMIDEIPADPADQVLAAQARQDVIDYTAGVNAYIAEARNDASKLPAEYGALQIVPEDWKPTDTVAVGALIGGNLGVGGGGELGNAAFLNALQAAGHSETQARTIMADLRLADDPESPSSTDDPFPWDTELGPVDPASVAMPDPDSVKPEDEVVTDSCSDGSGSLPLPRTADGPFGPINLNFPDVMSNALLVGSKLSKSGSPIAVFGPQVAYWSPEILMEIDMHGPGVDARGIGFPGISMYVLLGRGDGYGYSATSASGDQVDVRAVKLCDPEGGTPTIESTSYIRYDGQCTPISVREDTWLSKPSAGGTGLPQQITISTERVALAGTPGSLGMRGGTTGIIQARGTVDGDPVAFVRQRVSYGGEVDSALTYVELMNPDTVNGAADFQRAFARFNFTFNWFYLDGKDIAFQLGGAHPVRAPGTDPDLPVWDATQWAWPSLLSFQGTPKDTSPAKGWMTSWNNKQAPGFRAADDNWGYTSVDRVLPLNDGIEAAIEDDRKVDLVELVRTMGSAATVDLRGYKVLPLLLQIVGDAGTDRLRSVVSFLQAWNEAGAHRLDADGDGQYEHQAAIAVMDQWWERATKAIFGPVLGAAYDELPYPTDVPPNAPIDHNGDAFNNGFYGQVQKDLRNVLGDPVEGAFSRKYCGDGVLAVCRTALLGSLDAAVSALEADQGSDPGAWDVSEVDDEIRFTNVGVSGIPPIPWQNRPTFQQVLEFQPVGSGGREGGKNEVPKACRVDVPASVTQILGTAGNDVLEGTAGRDVICGLGGRDRLVGFAGNDAIYGGSGKDVVKGGSGNDKLVGEDGKDRLRGGKGDDSLIGGGGRDRCGGAGGDDLVRTCELGHA